MQAWTDFLDLKADESRFRLANFKTALPNRKLFKYDRAFYGLDLMLNKPFGNPKSLIAPSPKFMQAIRQPGCARRPICCARQVRVSIIVCDIAMSCQVRSVCDLSFVMQPMG